MKDQHSMGLLGRLPNFLLIFFFLERKVHVRVEATLSNLHKYEEGVSQISIFVSDTV